MVAPFTIIASIRIRYAQKYNQGNSAMRYAGKQPNLVRKKMNEHINEKLGTIAKPSYDQWVSAVSEAINISKPKQPQQHRKWKPGERAFNLIAARSTMIKHFCESKTAELTKQNKTIC